MLRDADLPAEHGGGGLLLRDVLPLPGVGVADAPEAVRVTVVGADVPSRQRVMELLAHTPGIHVVGWADSVQALAVLDLRSDVCLAVDSRSEDRPAEDEAIPPAVAAVPAGPQLSARQQEALVAYSQGNQLLDVVARGLGIGPETLKTHLRRIRVKYEEAGRPAPTRRDLYVRALEDGLLSPPR